MSDEDPRTLPSGDELYCFLNGERACGADCMSFRTIPDKNTQLDDAQNHCILLGSIERSGRSLNILAAVAGKKAKEAQDAARKAATPGGMPNPMGGKS